MPELFNRRAIVYLGAEQGTLNRVKIEGLRVSFKVIKTDEPEPNDSEISVWNLAESTRGRIKDRTLPVSLEAGYGKNLALIFSGDIDPKGVSSRREGPDWITTFKASDSGEAFRTARIQESISAGAKLGPVLKKMAQSLGVKTGNSIEKLKQGDLNGAFDTFFSGVTLSGPAFKESQRLLKSSGWDMQIHNGELEVTASNQPLDLPVVLLTSSTGLIGSPEPGDKGVIRFDSLLNPEIGPRRKVDLKSKTISGLYMVKKVTLIGDTDGQQWYSQAEALQR